MIISFRNTRDETFYKDEERLKAAHGEQMTRKINARISELEVAENPQNLPRNARFHPHQGKRKGLFSVDLVHPFRLIIQPTCKYNSYIEIISVEIYEIFNPHK
jgi:proteic killer suppression protein